MASLNDGAGDTTRKLRAWEIDMGATKRTYHCNNQDFKIYKRRRLWQLESRKEDKSEAIFMAFIKLFMQRYLIRFFIVTLILSLTVRRAGPTKKDSF
jgi:hypothetical protein